MAKSLYELLGVESTATIKEIRKAYYKLAKQYHPDTNPDVDGDEFVAITNAYRILSNPEWKTQYDTFGTISGLGEEEPGIEFTEAEQSVLALFMSVFSNYVSDSDYDTSRIASIVESKVQYQISQLKHNINELEKKIAILGGMPVIYQKSKTKYNLVALALNHTISMTEQELENNTEELVLAEEMMQVVQDFIEQNKPEETPQIEFKKYPKLGPVDLGNGKFTYGPI